MKGLETNYDEMRMDIVCCLWEQKMGCLNCPYYNLCQKPCWISIVFEGYKPTNCPYARIYKDIVKDKKLQEDFERFRNDRNA